jgi:surfeit locus 1 family protein
MIPTPAFSSPPRRALLVTPRGVLASVALLAVVALCVRVGFWQLDRRAERRALNAAIVARADAAPISEPWPLRDSAGISYRAARLGGRYDHERSVVLPGRSLSGAPGVHLLTPLRIEGLHAALLVNRGWVPAADGVTIDFDFFAAENPDAVEGLLLPFPLRGAAGAGAAEGATVPFRRVWYGFDGDGLRAQFPYPLLDVHLQLTGDGRRTIAPLPLAPPALDEGPHLGYAIQWFAFALIGFVGWGVLVLKGRAAAERTAEPQLRE